MRGLEPIAATKSPPTVNQLLLTPYSLLLSISFSSLQMAEPLPAESSKAEGAIAEGSTATASESIISVRTRKH